MQRGPTQDTNNPEEACFPGEKGKNAWDAGWRNVLYINRHLGNAGADGPSAAPAVTSPERSRSRSARRTRAAHDIFDRPPPAFGLPYDDETDLAPVGTQGDKVCGHVGVRRLGLRASVPQQRGQARADRQLGRRGVARRAVLGRLRRPLDPRARPGSDARTCPTSPTTPPARARSRSATRGIEETGAFIDQGGNNFWGVEYFNSPGTATAARVLRPRLRPVHPQIHRPAARSSRRRPPPTRRRPAAAGRLATRPAHGSRSCRRGGRACRPAFGRARFRLRFDEAVRLEVTLRGRLSRPSGSRGAQRKLAERPRDQRRRGSDRDRHAAGRAPRCASGFASEQRLPGLLRVKAMDAAGNVATRTKTLLVPLIR